MGQHCPHLVALQWVLEGIGCFFFFRCCFLFPLLDVTTKIFSLCLSSGGVGSAAGGAGALLVPSGRGKGVGMLSLPTIIAQVISGTWGMGRLSPGSLLPCSLLLLAPGVEMLSRAECSLWDVEELFWVGVTGQIWGNWGSLRVDTGLSAEPTSTTLRWLWDAFGVWLRMEFRDNL